MSGGGTVQTARASGRVTVVQEQRFHLRTDAGQVLRLTLSGRAPLDGMDLCRLKDAGAHVVVEYSGQPGLASGVAHDVWAQA